MAELAQVSQLQFREDLYPRAKVSEAHLAELQRVAEGGHELPPIIVWREHGLIADGVHRWTLASRRGDETIAAEYRDYADEAEFFKDSVLLNTAHGLNLSSYDRLKVIEIGARYGMRELDLAGILRTSPSFIKAVMPRYANVVAAKESGKDEPVRVQRVPLKGSLRHLSGRTITPEQADAIAGLAPGTSYLLGVRQLVSALKHDLLPPPGQHPVLWRELGVLRELLEQALAGKAAVS